MAWTGTWQNQYGSTLRITDESDGMIRGSFATALSDSGFFGEAAAVVGQHQGDCISVCFRRRGSAGDTIASFTGLRRNGKIETLWHVVADTALKAPAAGAPAKLEKLVWAHATMTGADTFERVDKKP